MAHVTDVDTQAAPAAPKKKKVKVQHVLQVRRTTQLTPHLRRVVLGGEGFSAIEFTSDTDQYIKMLFADPSLQLSRPFDMEELRETVPVSQRPVTRTYTVRHIDREAEEIWVDMVTHGDSGLAGPWAQTTQPGDEMSFFGPGSGYAPRSEMNFHFLAGDESAIPAIAAALEAMSSDARGLALIEVKDATEELPLTAPQGVEVRWLHRGSEFTPETALLAQHVAEMELDQPGTQIFIHGEREQMKAIRRVLVKERGMDRKAMSLSAYWAYGRGEDQFQAEKKLPVGQIDPEEG